MAQFGQEVHGEIILPKCLKENLINKSVAPWQKVFSLSHRGITALAQTLWEILKKEEKKVDILKNIARV